MSSVNSHNSPSIGILTLLKSLKMMSQSESFEKIFKKNTQKKFISQKANLKDFRLYKNSAKFNYLTDLPFLLLCWLEAMEMSLRLNSSLKFLLTDGPIDNELLSALYSLIQRNHKGIKVHTKFTTKEMSWRYFRFGKIIAASFGQ